MLACGRVDTPRASSTSRLLVPYAPGAVVLEVKYDAYLPDIVRDAIQVPGAVRVAHSKYALARRLE